MGNGENLCEVKIKRGIFQGDSLSPLLFVMAMIPLTFLLRRETFGFKFKGHDTVINHLFFMADLKLYAKTERELNELMHFVHRFSSDIGMEFGFDKCAVIVLNAGGKVESQGIDLPGGDNIKELDDKRL